MKTYKTEFVLNKTMIGVLLAPLLCLLVIGYATDSITLVILSIIVSFALFSKKGITIDFENKRIQEFTSVMFLNIGTWYGAESYKNFQLGNQNTIGRISSSIAFSTSYKVSNAVIYLKKKESQDMVLLAKGEEEIINELGLQLEKELGIPRKTKKQKTV